MILWIGTIAITLLWPAFHAIANPFIAPVATLISRRKSLSAMWLALFSGLFRDVILSSPRFGLMGLVSLLSASMINSLFRFVSVDGALGRIFLTFALALSEAVLTPLLVMAYDDRLSASMWSWKSFFLFVTITTAWMTVVEISSFFLTQICRRPRGTCGENS